VDAKTRRQLDAINRSFYAELAEEFSRTRSRPWPGWERLIEKLPEPGPSAAVLDVGCGNGRFANFLEERWQCAHHYLGIDSSEALLEIARRRAPRRERIRFARCDVVNGDLDRDLPPGPFDLIGLFGILHHVPGVDRRGELVEKLARRLAPGGHLALASWRFGAFERFRRRILSWEDYNRDAKAPVDASHLEPGDHLLRWGGEGDPPRYCHFADAEELDRLLAGLCLECVDSFHADGASGDLNHYRLLRRPAVPNSAQGVSPPSRA
jgi:SAM-dependent methyltransferase